MTKNMIAITCFLLRFSRDCLARKTLGASRIFNLGSAPQNMQSESTRSDDFVEEF